MDPAEPLHAFSHVSSAPVFTAVLCMPAPKAHPQTPHTLVEACQTLRKHHVRRCGLPERAVPFESSWHIELRYSWLHNLSKSQCMLLKQPRLHLQAEMIKYRTVLLVTLSRGQWRLKGYKMYRMEKTVIFRAPIVPPASRFEQAVPAFLDAVSTSAFKVPSHYLPKFWVRLFSLNQQHHGGCARRR
jgi:hypothetical protein